MGLLKQFGKIKGNPRISQTCWGDFRFNLCLPGPRGGHRWTRLVPQFGFLQLSSKSGLWEGISWPFFVLENPDIRLLKHVFPNPQKLCLLLRKKENRGKRKEKKEKNERNKERKRARKGGTNKYNIILILMKT